jgi:hypothetical protein
MAGRQKNGHDEHVVSRENSFAALAEESEQPESEPEPEGYGVLRGGGAAPYGHTDGYLTGEPLEELLLPGARVEVRPVRWYDDLYWEGRVKKRNDSGTYCVEIENGDVEPDLPPNPYHMVPYSRDTVFSGEEVLVTDGHSLVPGLGVNGPIVRIRLLSFRSRCPHPPSAPPQKGRRALTPCCASRPSPHLYQSGVLLECKRPHGPVGDAEFRWDPVAFEIIQTTVMSMGFLSLRRLCHHARFPVPAPPPRPPAAPAGRSRRGAATAVGGRGRRGRSRRRSSEAAQATAR